MSGWTRAWHGAEAAIQISDEPFGEPVGRIALNNGGDSSLYPYAFATTLPEGTPVSLDGSTVTVARATVQLGNQKGQV